MRKYEYKYSRFGEMRERIEAKKRLEEKINNAKLMVDKRRY